METSPALPVSAAVFDQNVSESQSDYVATAAVAGITHDKIPSECHQAEGFSNEEASVASAAVTGSMHDKIHVKCFLKTPTFVKGKSR